MANMSKTQRGHFYPQIVIIQFGEYCRGCGISPLSQWKNKSIDILVIDHVDNDNSNNRLENLQLLCRSCNRIKNPSLIYSPDLIKTQSEATNKRAEDAWRAWTMEKVLKNSGYNIDELIYSGAELFKISPETIQRRYLPKLTSVAGLFKEIEGVLFLKSMEGSEKEVLEHLKGKIVN